MTETRSEDTWSLDRRGIYRDVYDKRVDERPVEDIAELPKARVKDGHLCFASETQQDQALLDGIFMLKIPTGVELEACDLFSQTFHRGEETPPYGLYRTLTAETFRDPLLGFHERINQIEQFLLERRFWSDYYPVEIASAGECLTALAETVLRSILGLTDIPRTAWTVATGGAAESQGSYHLTFNHYRPGLAGVGLSSHKDDGFMTILRTTSLGFEVNKNNRWEAVEPDPGYFIINFGLSMEVLTRGSSRPVRAIMHRVRHQTKDRSSFGHFTSSYCEPGFSAGIYSFSSDRGLEQVCSSRELINANDEEIYLGTRLPEDRPS